MGLSVSEIIFIVVLVVLVLSVGQLPAMAEAIARTRHKIPKGPKQAVNIGPAERQAKPSRTDDIATIQGPVEDAELIEPE